MTSSEPDRSATNLPGVGSSLELCDTSGHRFLIVRRRDHVVEIYADGTHVAEFDHVNARAMGTFMSGHLVAAPELVERLDDVLGGLSLDWIRVEPGWTAAGRTIEQLAVRTTTGVSIVAILRGSVPLVSPDPSTVIVAGDELVVACREQDLASFTRYMAEGR